MSNQTMLHDELEHVNVVYGPSSIATKQNENPLTYKVINKRTGVVEYEDQVLPDIWRAAQQLNKAIGDVYDMMQGIDPVEIALPKTKIVGTGNGGSTPQPH